MPSVRHGRVVHLQQCESKVAMVGDGVNYAHAVASADLAVDIGTDTDVAIETVEVVLMRSDLLNVPTAIRIDEGTLRKMRRNRGWAIGYKASPF